jgi:tetratricopeptide (TPR) repeat protein
MMKVLVRIVVSLLMIILLSISLCYALNVAGQSTTEAIDYASQGKFKEAKEEIEKALKADPSFGPAKRVLKIIDDVADQKIEGQTAIYYFKGIASALKGQYDQSIPYYDKAIEINPKFANAYFSRGVAYAKGRGEYDKAISDYDKAIEINQRFGKAILSRGVANYYKGEYNKAWDDVRKAQSLGYQVHPGFLKALGEASGRKK